MSTLTQRSGRGRSDGALDQIHLSGIAARGFHGVLESEREAGQDFSADVTLYLDTRPAARGDDLTETVNYAVVAQDVADILSGAPVNLIETVAEQIAAAVLARPAVAAVDVAVHKPQAPIPVPFDDVVVSIHRDRTTVAVASPVEGAVADLSGLEADTAEPETMATDAVVDVAEAPETLTVPEVEDAPEPAAAREDVELAEPAVETPQVRRDPLPTAVLPVVVVSRPAEPEGEDLVASGMPLDGPRDAPPMIALVTHSDVLAAPLAAPTAPVPTPISSSAQGDPAQLDQPAAALPPVPFPGADSSGAGQTPVEPAAEPAPSTPPLGIDRTVVLAPLDEEVLAEQARMSEQTRRPEVFGVATLSTGWAPLTTDSDQVPSVTAPEDFLTAEIVGLDEVSAHDVQEDQAQEDVVHSGDDHPAAVEREPAASVEVAEPADDVLETSEPITAEVSEPVEDQPADAAEDLSSTAVLPRVVDKMDTVATEPVEVVIALGANLGDAQDTLRRAVADLHALSALTITAVGPLARTAPVGGPDQPDYLNTVVLATTTMSPRELLHACQSIEAEHGRQRLEHWGPRTLDIDLITYGALVYSADDLDIPHPRANERAFVLAPWAHLSPDAVLPGLGGGPVGALAATAPDRDGIRWLALDWLAEPERAHQPTAPEEPTRAAQGDSQHGDQLLAEQWRGSADEADGEPDVVPQAPPL